MMTLAQPTQPHPRQELYPQSHTLFDDGPLHRELQKVLRINSTWIVRGDLAHQAEEYLLQLWAFEPGKVGATLNIVNAVMDSLRNREEFFGIDPKPFFYAAVFAYASYSQREEFIETHYFTKTILAVARGEPEMARLPLTGLRQASRDRIEEAAMLLCECQFILSCAGLDEDECGALPFQETARGVEYGN